VGGVRKSVGLAFFWLYHYDVITSTKGQNIGSNLVVFLAGI